MKTLGSVCAQGLNEYGSNGSGKGYDAVTCYCCMLLLGLTGLKHPIEGKLRPNVLLYTIPLDYSLSIPLISTRDWVTN